MQKTRWLTKESGELGIKNVWRRAAGGTHARMWSERGTTVESMQKILRIVGTQWRTARTVSGQNREARRPDSRDAHVLVAIRMLKINFTRFTRNEWPSSLVLRQSLSNHSNRQYLEDISCQRCSVDSLMPSLLTIHVLTGANGAAISSVPKIFLSCPSGPLIPKKNALSWLAAACIFDLPTSVPHQSNEISFSRLQHTSR